MSKKSDFRGCFEKQYDKPAQKLFKSASQHIYPIHWSLARSFCWKKSLLLKYQIVRVLVNTLATDEEYSVLNRENLRIPIQRQLFQKQKTFSQLLDAFLKSRLNFKHFESEHDPHTFCIFEVTDSENVVR